MSQGFPGQGQWSGGWQPQLLPPQKPKRTLAPVILGTLAVIGLAMVGLILYSLFAGPDYQNDEYVPPPPGATLPLPNGDAAEVNTYLTANELYAQSVPEPVRCELPNADFDVPSATDEQIATYINELMACSMRVWNPPFEATNRWQLTRPKVNIYREFVVTPCGRGEREGPNGIYCAANQEVYFSRDVARWQRPHIVDDVMAHEFAHHVQARSLIMLANFHLQSRSDKATALELNRRNELQADCYEGMFMQSIYQSRGYTEQQLADIRQSLRDDGADASQRRAGRPVAPGSHGTSDARLSWWTQGITGTDIDRCNTYAAPPELVP